MYLTYDEYKSMGGTLEETAFVDHEREAEMTIDWETFNRLHEEEEIPQAVKTCMYMLMKLVQKKSELMYANAENGEAQITSQSNDGVSISYNVLSAADVFAQNKVEISDTIKRCLFDVKNSKGHRLTYRGVYPDE